MENFNCYCLYLISPKDSKEEGIYISKHIQFDGKLVHMFFFKFFLIFTKILTIQWYLCRTRISPQHSTIPDSVLLMIGYLFVLQFLCDVFFAHLISSYAKLELLIAHWRDAKFKSTTQCIVAEIYPFLFLVFLQKLIYLISEQNVIEFLYVRSEH